MVIFMGMIVVGDNLNTNITPTYQKRDLMYNVFNIYHINNVISCSANNKLFQCIDDSDFHYLENLPLKLSAQYKASYDINYIGDQDGIFDDNCSRAIINKLQVSQNMSYLECQDGKCDDALDIIFSKIFPTMFTNTENLVYAAKTIIDGVINHSDVLINDNVTKNIDINSGVYNYSKSISYQLYENDSIPLEGESYFLESMSISAEKSGNVIDIGLNIKAITIEMILDEIELTTDPIDISTTCG